MSNFIANLEHPFRFRELSHSLLISGMDSITDNLLLLLLTVSVTITLILIYYYYQDICY